MKNVHPEMVPLRVSSLPDVSHSAQMKCANLSGAHTRDLYRSEP